MTQPTKEPIPTPKSTEAEPKQPSTDGSGPRSNTPPYDRPPDPCTVVQKPDLSGTNYFKEYSGFYLINIIFSLYTDILYP